MEKEVRKSKPKIDLTGQSFGRWTVLEYVKPGKWKCECSCENHTIKLVEGRNLRGGKTLSCGCLQKERTSQANSIDLTGQVFGKLTVIERQKKDGNTYYLCQCECGNQTIVDSRNLRSGHTTSCGCIKSKGETVIAKWLRENHINFEREKTFKDCKNLQSLKFDFYLLDYNLLIEYDGEQHFKISRFGNKSIEEATEMLKKQKENDNIKNNWCKENNISLLRIPYNKFNKINEILEEVINNGGNPTEILS